LVSFFAFFPDRFIERDDIGVMTVHKHRTDIITMSPGATIESTLAGFDFTHLQVYFDGVSLFATHDAMTALATKQTEMNVRVIPTVKEATWFKVSTRLEKYETRGFAVVNRASVQRIRCEQLMTRVELFDMNTAIAGVCANDVDVRNIRYQIYRSLTLPIPEQTIMGSSYLLYYYLFITLQKHTPPNVLCSLILEYIAPFAPPNNTLWMNKAIN
jgi:hypothetical protein